MFTVPEGFKLAPHLSTQLGADWKASIKEPSAHFSQERREGRLFDLCRWNMPDDAKELLSSNPNINIFYKDGKFFDFALSHKSLPMLEVLLKHCELNSPREINEKMLFEYRLKSILSHALETHNVPQEIEDRISPYLLDFDKDTDDEPDLDFDLQEAISFVDQDDILENHLQTHIDAAGKNSSVFE
jgi:hypothetical protein